ncbi:conserved hypothetical protein [Tenacibaculum litoreum]|uniref:hypothetical protein n=1 Tax=Tenacibaculum litoreum TaxID=321269 RepID=UPI0038932C58
MIKNKILTLIVILTNVMVFGQSTKDSNLILTITEEQNLSFHKYEPRLQLKATLTTISEVKNEFPEQLMQSILSARNQEWVNYNTLGGEEKASKKEPSHFEKIVSMNKDENYFELHHKFTFNLGDIPTTIIKFYFYQENEKPLSAAYVMQKVNGRWQRTSHSSLSMLSIIVMRMKSEVLEGIILGNSTDASIQAITERVTTNGALDVKKLEDEFASWYTPKKDDIKINLYKDPKSW